MPDEKILGLGHNARFITISQAKKSGKEIPGQRDCFDRGLEALKIVFQRN